MFLETSYKTFTALLLLLVVTSCHPRTHCIDPRLPYTPTACDIVVNDSLFLPLTSDELKTDWGKELLIAEKFAKELDFYRAITNYKRASFLLPPEETARRSQIEYGIISCYFIAGKYKDVIREFEESKLIETPKDAPFFKDLLILLMISYSECKDPYRKKIMEDLLRSIDEKALQELQLSSALMRGDINTLYTLTPLFPEELNWLPCFEERRLSPQKAQTLNALLPGAGYLYVGQKKTAITSFLLNAVFITAAVQFFREGYTAAGVIATSLECGWYFGGINGAGLAAKEFNDHLYNFYARESLNRNKLFPCLMIQYGF